MKILDFLDRLEPAARAATQGEWISTGIVIGVPAEGGLDYILEATSKNHDADTAYLELVQPESMLQLIAAMRQTLEP